MKSMNLFRLPAAVVVLPSGNVMEQYDVASTGAAIFDIEQTQARTGRPAKASFK